MSVESLAVRARGLGTRAVEATGPLAAAATGPLAAAATGAPLAVEDLLRERTAQELAILHRWGGDAVAAFELDEDRRTLRTIARGIRAGTPATSRVAGAVPTSSLPHGRVARVATCATFREAAEALQQHPLAEAFAHGELFDVEHELARRCFARMRVRDAAFATYRGQLVDLENAAAALLLAQRRGELAPAALFLEGGRVLDIATFTAAVAERAHERLARAFAGTPLARALFAAEPAALEDAGLAWQLATQTQLRRIEPLGLAPVLWLVLRRREEARRLRARAWRSVLGGEP